MFPSAHHLRMPAGRLDPVRPHDVAKEFSRPPLAALHPDSGHDTRAFVEGRVEVHRDGPLANLDPMEFRWDDAASDDCFARCGFDFAVVIRATPGPNRIVGSGRCWDYGEERYRLFREIKGQLFDRTVSSTMNRLLANRRETCELAKTRDLLLPKLMSGEIRPADAERAVKAVV